MLSLLLLVAGCVGRTVATDQQARYRTDGRAQRGGADPELWTANSTREHRGPSVPGLRTNSSWSTNKATFGQGKGAERHRYAATNLALRRSHVAPPLS